MPLWLIIVLIIGVVLNWAILIPEIDDSPEGAVGTLFGMLAAMIPFLVVLLWIIVKIRDKAGFND